MIAVLWVVFKLRSVMAFVPDAAFLLLSLRSVYVNLKEVIPALMAGLDGLINYLTFWKSVEWISLLFGIGCFVAWVSGSWIIIMLQEIRFIIELPTNLQKHVIEVTGFCSFKDPTTTTAFFWWRVGQDIHCIHWGEFVLADYRWTSSRDCKIA